MEIALRSTWDGLQIIKAAIDVGAGIKVLDGSYIDLETPMGSGAMDEFMRHQTRSKSMSDFVDEEHCPLCSRAWPSEREAFRANLDELPLDEPVCNACLMAFWRNLGLPVADDDSAEH